MLKKLFLPGTAISQFMQVQPVSLLAAAIGGEGDFPPSMRAGKRYSLHCAL